MLVNSRGKHPVIIGPMFIHQRKEFKTLVGLLHALRSIRSFGTDGARRLSTLFLEKLCICNVFLHFRGNLDAKLKQLGISKSCRVEFLRVVFGNPAELEEGLVDVNSDELFEATIQSLEKVWNEREQQFNATPQFYNWFVTYCKHVVKSTMLKSYRIALYE